MKWILNKKLKNFSKTRKKYLLLVLNMSINFLQQFATISLDENIDITDNLKKLSINNNVDEMKNEKQKNDKTEQKNYKTEKTKKQNRFMHTNNVVMVCGQYKGYNAFVYEYFPSKVNMMIKEQAYVFAKMYGEKSAGDMINTPFGQATILSKVESLCNVFVSVKGENGEECGYDIRLPRRCFVRMVTFIENGITKIAQLLKVKDNIYDMVVMKFDYSKQKTKEDLIKMYSDILVSCQKDYNKICGERIKKTSVQCSDEYYVVCQKPMDSGVPNYVGKYGKLRCEIPEQYFVETKRVVSVNESHSKIEGNSVRVAVLEF